MKRKRGDRANRHTKIILDEVRRSDPLWPNKAKIRLWFCLLSWLAWKQRVFFAL